MLAKVFSAGLMAAILSVSQQASRPLTADTPNACASCSEWNTDAPPFALYGNTYYVGTAGLSSVLITSPEGHVLIDGGLPQSAALIDAHIRQLGFRTVDIKLILTSHAHFDHIGGIAALQRYTGATVAASPSSAEALRLGHPTADDPQFRIPDNGFPAVASVRTIADREVLHVGPIAITAHFTPGHTPGSTTWTWQSCDSGRCLGMVYADSLTAVSADGFRFSGDRTTPGRATAFFRSIAIVDRLPCDVLVTSHPSASGLDRKRAAQVAGSTDNPFIDPAGCHTYAAGARSALEKRLAQER